jgi:tetratricopeptide (TPR) repeat protein
MANNQPPNDDRTLPHTVPTDPKLDTRTFPHAAHTQSEDAPTRTDPPTFVVRTTELPEVPGYVVTREIARGGMGVVYEARDPVFERELAVKVMYPGQNAGRFLVEAKVTAGLPHPGVPPVHSLGSMPDGRPFLTMKLIRGRTLADELQAPKRAELPQLLDIFLHVCQTVGFAHSKGIIHRDLKPSNIMVGSFGEVQVMDWGLARDEGRRMKDEGKTDASASSSIILPPSSFPTQAGEVKGTPAFMAPEQARGEPVDARADVFALGGILAAILTGSPPFSGNTVADTVLRAAQANLRACFEALEACGVDAELVAVAKKCLAPRAAERYANGEDVAAAVSAYRAGVEDRLHRAERERAAAEARAAEEVNTRREAEARAEAERKNATEQRKRRRAQLMVAAVVLVLLGGAGAFAWWRDKQAGERKLTEERTGAERKLAAERAEAQRMRLEADARAVAARHAGELAAESRIRVEQARQGVHSGLVLATDLRKQSKFKQAALALAQAADLARGGAPELLGAVEDAQRTLAFVVALDDIRYRKWAWIAESGGGRFDTKRAPPAYHKTFADHGLDLTVLAPPEAAERIAASAVRAELVTAVDDWALYEPDEALRSRLLEVARQADPNTWTDQLRDPAVWGDRAALVKLAATADLATTPPAVLSVLAELMRRNRLDAAPFLSAARVKHPTDFGLAFALGQCFALNTDGRQIGPFEAARALRPDSATVWQNLSVALGWTGDFAGELAACREAVRLDPLGASARSNLGAALRENGDWDGAVVEFKAALLLDPKFATAYDGFGIALARKGDRDGAIGVFREAVGLEPTFARAHNNLGVALKEKGDLDGAIAAYKDAIGVEPGYASAWNNLGAALHLKGDLDGAIRAFREAARLNPKFALAHSNLGSILEARGDVAGAVEAYRGAVRADPKLASAHGALASIYLQQKKYPEALDCARAALRADPKFAHAHAMLGLALLNTGDISGARSALTEAARLDPKRWGPVLDELPPLEVAPPPREVKRP